MTTLKAAIQHDIRPLSFTGLNLFATVHHYGLQRVISAVGQRHAGGLIFLRMAGKKKKNCKQAWVGYNPKQHKYYQLMEDGDAGLETPTSNAV